MTSALRLHMRKVVDVSAHVIALCQVKCARLASASEIGSGRPGAPACVLGRSKIRPLTTFAASGDLRSVIFRGGADAQADYALETVKRKWKDLAG